MPLPEITTIELPIEIDNRADYDKSKVTAKKPVSVQSLDDEININIYNKQAEVAEQVCSKGKMFAIREWVTSFVIMKKKVVIFSKHPHIIKEMHGWFPTKTIVMDKTVDNFIPCGRFQSSPDMLIAIVSMDCLSEDFVLNRANDCAFVEVPSEKEFELATSKVHVSKHDVPLTCYIFVAVNTIEDARY